MLLRAERAARSTAEEALGLVEAILTSAPVGIAVFDLDLRYARVNDAYAALSGIPAADHVGGQLGDVVPLQADVAADLRRVVTTGRTILGRQVELMTDSGGDEQRSFTVSYFPVRSTAGVLVGAGLTLVEVTAARSGPRPSEPPFCGGPRLLISASPSWPPPARCSRPPWSSTSS